VIRFSLYCCFVFCLLVNLGCGKDDENSDLIFEGVLKFDINGAGIGCFGECDEDWSNIQLSDDELTYLDFVDNVDMTGAGNESVVEDVFVYPNPIANSGDQNFGYLGTGKVKLKLAVINKKKEVLFTEATALEYPNFFFNISALAFADFERKEIYRMYYALYNEANTILFMGYGDISVCTLDGNNVDETCFN